VIPRLRHRARRLLLAVLSFLVLALAAGTLYQTISVRREAARFPPPGQLVDVGGRRLHLVCIGDGDPTVIFEPSALGGAVSGSAARAEISAQTRVCSYDRMGTGWSDPGPAIIPTGVLVSDLEHLVDRAGLRPPFILVSASIGGLTAELYARRHPDRIAGLVFLDAANSVALERFAPQLNRATTWMGCALPIAARLGVLRLIDPLGLRSDASEAAARTMFRLYRAEPMATLCGVLRGLPASVHELRTAPPLAPDVALTVLIADSTEGLLPLGLRPPGSDSAWAAVVRERESVQQEFARHSSQGISRVVAGSRHLIADSQPHAVASGVLEMLAAIRRPSR